MTGNGTTFEHLVCTCNQVNDFPQKCPYHSPQEYYKFYTPPQYWPSNVTGRQSWLCTRCNKMKAPHVDECACATQDWALTYDTVTTTATGTYTDNKLHICTENGGCKSPDCDNSR